MKIMYAMNKEDKHYDNTNGSIYKFCEQQKLNAYEFDIIKRIVRCRKKGNFIEDLEKTKRVIDLYIKEQDTSEDCRCNSKTCFVGYDGKTYCIRCNKLKNK